MKKLLVVFNWKGATLSFLSILNMKRDLKHSLARFSLCFISLFASFSNAQTPFLFGMTYLGGINGDGNIFAYSPTLNSYYNLVNFTGTSGSYLGEAPHYGHLMKGNGGLLYGLTGFGGTNTDGNMFNYNPGSNTFTDMVDFTGTSGTYSGEYPYGSLLEAADSTLYGMTLEGGVNGLGNIFRYFPATGIYADLADFTGTTGAYLGSQPDGNLIQAYDGNLYGMTRNGGTLGDGNIFSYNPNTQVFTDLVDFTGPTGSYPGRNPMGSLVQASDSNLYGMTDAGGTGFMGSIFKYNIATNTFTNLLDFTGATGAYVGYGPEGSLIQATDGNLYGMTLDGGPLTYGNIFRYNPDSGTFTNLLNFTDQTGSYLGGSPYGTLLQASDSNLYGLAEQGGANNYGVLFQYHITTGAYTDMVDFTGIGGSFIGENPYGDLMEYPYTVTGTNEVKGESDRVKVFPNPNDGIFTVVCHSERSEESIPIMEIYNTLGQKIYNETPVRTGTGGLRYAQGDNLIDLKKQPDGVYFYRVLKDNGELVGEGKIIIAK